MPDARKSVGIVGARMCSEYGRSIATKLGKMLAGKDVQVISGMALGIDSASHAGALQGKGSTFAVLGCGCDICYPKNAGICMKISRLPAEVFCRSIRRERNRCLIASRSATASSVPVRQSGGGRGKKKEWISDHGRRGAGTGQRCLCGAGALRRCIERRMQCPDWSGRGNLSMIVDIFFCKIWDICPKKM